MKNKILILFVTLSFIINTGKGQSYTVTSLAGKKSKISLYYKPASGTLRVSHLKDTLYITNYMSLEHVRLMNNVFLSIEYVKRVGSNQDAMRLLFLYIQNGKLCQALHVNSLKIYDLRPSEYESFRLKSTLIGANAESYKLQLNIHDEKNSKLATEPNYKYDKTNILAFDNKNYTFYNGLETLAGTYTLNESDANGEVKKISKKYVKKVVPTIKIRDDKYYNIDHKWYTKAKTDFYAM